MSEDRSVLTRPAPPPARTWAYGPDDDQVADLYEVPAGREVRAPVVLVHGGYWRPAYDRLHLRPLAAALADAGHPTLSLEYRRQPGIPDASVDDVVSALGDAPTVLGSHPVLVGHSAGGHLALLAAHAAAPHLRAVLALAPVADLGLAERLDLDDGAAVAFLGTSAADRPDLDPALLPAPTLPTRVLHGEDDALVPPEVSLSYSAATSVLLHLQPRTGHFDWIDPRSPAWPVLLGQLGALTEHGGIEWRA